MMARKRRCAFGDGSQRFEACERALRRVQWVLECGRLIESCSGCGEKVAVAKE